MTALAFVDTNVWVYALTTANPVRQKQAGALLNQLEQPCVNGQILREIGRVLLQKHGIDESSFRRICQMMARSCQWAPDTLSTYFLASDLRSRENLSYWDSFIVAAALDAGCTTLYSEDMQHGQVLRERLKLINPFITCSPDNAP